MEKTLQLEETIITLNAEAEKLVAEIENLQEIQQEMGEEGKIINQRNHELNDKITQLEREN